MDPALLQAVAAVGALSGGLVGLLRAKGVRRSLARNPRRRGAVEVRYHSAMEPKATLGDRVRRVREEQGITIAALAETCRVSEGAIRQIETGAVKSPR